MSQSGPLFDPGLQPERTGLAWRRTAVSLAVGSLLALRILPASGAGASVLFSLTGLDWTGLGVAVVVFVVGERRYRQVHRLLTREEPGGVGGGASLLVVAVTCGILAAGALAFVLA